MGSTGDFKPLAGSVLFTPIQLGALKLEHRLVYSPLTRMRASKESDGVWTPSDLNVLYYSQRASQGGFILTEATPISRLVSSSSVHTAFFSLAVGCRIPWSSWYLHSWPN